MFSTAYPTIPNARSMPSVPTACARAAVAGLVRDIARLFSAAAR